VQEIEGYRKEVETHFDKTATLFVSMAGSYKELFEHLSSGYEKLSSGSARTLFQQRVDALLVGSARDTGEADKLLAGVGAAAAVATVADAAAVEAAGADAPDVDTRDAAASGAVAPSPRRPTRLRRAPRPKPLRKSLKCGTWPPKPTGTRGHRPTIR